MQNNSVAAYRIAADKMQEILQPLDVLMNISLEGVGKELEAAKQNIINLKYRFLHLCL